VNKSGLMDLANTLNTYGKGRSFQKEATNAAMKFPLDYPIAYINGKEG
jgi:hypothetical protein